MFCLQSFPQDNEKVKVTVLSNLYAYEVPPPPPIPTMSAAEEKGWDDTTGQTVNGGCGEMGLDTPVHLVNAGDSVHSKPVTQNHNNNTISLGLNVIQRMNSSK